MVIIVVTLAVLIFAIIVFMRMPQFGSAPSGKRLEEMKRSPNYRDGQFQNQSLTPALTEGVSYYAVIKEFFFSKKERVKPDHPVPSKKEDLHALPPDKNVLVWFGHSSYFMQVDGKRILVDPVFSGHASPVAFTTRSFPGTDVYTVDDLPPIDLLFITHDHWDHLDHQTVIQLKPKVKKLITGLGVGAHLERWGYDKEVIIERDWNEEIQLGGGFTVHTAPARHFSGRGFKRNGTLWSSFVLLTPNYRFYLGGDSGYDKHFKTIGDQFGPFDLAILEDGQYDKSWKYIHMIPEEVVQAGEDLRARRILPVHWSKFALGNHPWDEPIIRISREAEKRGMPLLKPMIGELNFI